MRRSGVLRLVTVPSPTLQSVLRPHIDRRLSAKERGEREDTVRILMGGGWLNANILHEDKAFRVASFGSHFFLVSKYFILEGYFYSRGWLDACLRWLIFERPKKTAIV